METQAFIESLEYQAKRLCDKLAQLESGARKVFIDGKDMSAEEAAELRHRVTENQTIISRLREREQYMASLPLVWGRPHEAPAPDQHPG